MNLPKPTWLGFVCLALVLAACRSGATPTPRVPDNSLLTNQPCAPPCWQGLIPDKTTAEETINFLKNSPLVNGNLGEQLTCPSCPGFTQDWWWAKEKQDGQRVNSFQFDGKRILERMDIVPNTVITAGKLVSVQGIPDLVAMGAVFPYDQFSDPTKGVGFTAMWVDEGFEVMWLEKTDIRGFPFNYCPLLNAPIYRIIYYNSERAAMRASMEWFLKGNSLIHVTDSKITMDCVEVK